MRFFPIASFCLCIFSTLHAQSIFSIADSVAAVAPSVVKIKVQRSDAPIEETELTSIDSSGSGFVYDNNHHIITNAHVLGNAKKIAVIDQNGTEYRADLVGKDVKTDIALLSVPAMDTASIAVPHNNFPVLGEGIFVMGYPFSLGQSVSVGIVSATERFLPNYPHLPFLQTDAAINPGNSGGPAFDLTGRWIGIASTYFSRQGSYTNIGFILPSAEVSRIADQLLQTGSITRGYLGAQLLVSERISRKLGNPASLFVSRIDPDGPAEEAGLRVGDLITGCEGIPFKEGSGLYRLLERSIPGQTIVLYIKRGKTLQSVQVRLGNAVMQTNEETNNLDNPTDAAAKLGLLLRQQGESMSVIASFASAKQVGIMPDDEIISINNQHPLTIQEFSTILAKLKETDIAILTIRRNTQNISFPIGTKAALKAYTSEY